MVLSREHLREMEGYWFPVVDPRQTYVLFPLGHFCLLTDYLLRSGLGEERPMVSFSSSLAA